MTRRTGVLRGGPGHCGLVLGDVRKAACTDSAKEGHVFKPLVDLGIFENLMLAGIAGIGADGRRKSIYVHSKLMLIDDEWATVGSCNLHRFSLSGNGEMNAAFSDPSTVRTFRCELLQEHLDRDTSGMDDRSALRLFREIARQNRRKLEAGDHAWQGLAFEFATACNEGS